MKIMFLLRFFPIYGGGEDVTLRLAEGFLGHGYEVCVGYLWDNGWEKITLDNRIKCIKLSDTKCVNGEDIKKDSYKEILKELDCAIAQEKIDCIINQWLPPQIVFKANNGRAKIITCRHAAIYINSFKWNLMRRLSGNFFDLILRFYYKDNIVYSDRWILLSKVFQEQVNSIYKGKYEKKIGYINNPCKYDVIDNMNNKVKEKNVLYVGRLYDAKRVDMLLDIWKKVMDSDNTDEWKFVIVGDGVERNKLEKYAEENAITNVIFEGYCNPEEYYKKSAIYVSASETEGYPMAIVEAMAYGCVPIVMNTYDSLDEIIDAKMGFAINNDSKEDFAKVIILLIKDEGRRKLMAEECIKKADMYNLEYIVKQWQIEFQNMGID